MQGEMPSGGLFLREVSVLAYGDALRHVLDMPLDLLD